MGIKTFLVTPVAAAITLPSVSPKSALRFSVLAYAMAYGVSATAASEAVQLDTLSVQSSVIGSSDEKDVAEYPGNRTILSQEQLKKTAATSIDGALQQVPGVKVQDETGTGVLPNVSVRGLSGSRSERAQFLMDGVPLTLAPYGHTGQSVFPATFNTLDRIDVVRGGAAVQYGPNNVGGVINLVTKPIPNQWETQISNRISAYEDSDNLMNNLYLRSGGWLSDDFGIQFSANTLNGDSYREHSDTDVTNFDIKADWLISEDKELQAFIQRYDADMEMPGALSPEAYQADRQQSQRLNDDYEATATRWHLKYLQDLDWGNRSQLEVLTFGHHDTRNFIWGFNTAGGHWADPAQPSTDIRNSPREFDVYGVEPKLSMSFGSQDTLTQNLILGMRYVNESIDYRLLQTNIATGNVTEPRDWRLETDAVAAYVSDEFGLMNGRLKITPGLRFESVHMNFEDANSGAKDSNQINEVLPGITAAYHVTDEWVAYANAQKSLRAPQIAQVRGAGKEEGEVSWNYELGARFTQGQSSFNAALFQVDYKDQLQWQSATQTFDNIGETRHQGVELAGRYSAQNLPGLSLGLAYTYLDATSEEEGPNKGNELPYASKHQVSWDATYDFSGYLSTLSGFYYSDAYSDNANTAEEDATGATGKIPSYTVWNVNVSKELYQQDNTTLSVDFSVNNLFDEEYYFRGVDTSPVGRYPGLGRSYNVTANLTF